MFRFRRIPEGSVAKAQVDAIVAPILFVFFLCVGQGILMASVALFFLSSNTDLSNWIFSKLSFLVDHVPVLWKHKKVFESTNRMLEFPAVFSVYVIFVVLQIFSLLIIFRILLKHTNVRVMPRMGLWLRIAYIYLVFASLFGIVYFALGPTITESDRSLANSYSYTIFKSCVISPTASLIFFLSLYFHFHKLEPQLEKQLSDWDQSRQIKRPEVRYDRDSS
jgi:hypothetical protein